MESIVREPLEAGLRLGWPYIIGNPNIPTSISSIEKAGLLERFNLYNLEKK